jgi:hypothetical protein
LNKHSSQAQRDERGPGFGRTTRLPVGFSKRVSQARGTASTKSRFVFFRSMVKMPPA